MVLAPPGPLEIDLAGRRRGDPRRRKLRHGAPAAVHFPGAAHRQVLPDPHEPLVHIYAEAANGADSGELADELERQIELIVQGDGAPARTGEKASS